MRTEGNPRSSREALDFACTYAAARAGDHGARERLVRDLLPDVARFLARRTGRAVLNHLEREDLLQRTFVAFAERLARLPECRDAQDLRALVLQLAKWEIARALSDARKADPKLESVSEFARERSRSRGSVTRADDVRRLEALLARMRPTYAAVLRCRLMEEKSAEETAVELGLTLENVKKRLLRARAELERLSARWARSERGESEGE